LFPVVIHWLLKETTARNETGMTWTEDSNLEDLDFFAYDLALISNNFEDLQTKTTTAEETGRKIGLNPIMTGFFEPFQDREKKSVQIYITLKSCHS